LRSSKKINPETEESAKNEQPRTQMQTNTQSNVATQDRTAKAKGEEQNDVTHHPGNDLRGIDESMRLLLEIHFGVINIVPVRRPIDSWEIFS
jgi:hypothetical protein